VDVWAASGTTSDTHVVCGAEGTGAVEIIRNRELRTVINVVTLLAAGHSAVCDVSAACLSDTSHLIEQCPGRFVNCTKH